MAKFLEKVKKILKNKVSSKVEEECKKEPLDFSCPEEPQIDAQGLTPAQRKRRESLLSEISRGHELPPDLRDLTKDKAKKELEQRIAEKMSIFNNEDQILEQIRQDKERQRLELEEEQAQRRKKRKQKREEDKNLPPIVTEDAIMAVYEEPSFEDGESAGELQNEPEAEPEKEKKHRIKRQTRKFSLLEGQLTIRDINTEIQKKRQEEELAQKPDITEITYKEAIEGEELPSDKLFVAIQKGFKGFQKKLRGIFAKVKEKNPEKAETIEAREKKASAKLQKIKNTIVETERRISGKMVNFINGVDHRGDVMADKAGAAARRSHIGFHRTRELVDKNKRIILASLTGIVTILIIAVALMNYLSAYEYSYNGKKLGLVKNQEDVYKILDLVSSQLTKSHGAEVIIDPEEDIAFNKVWNFKNSVDDVDAVLRRLTYMQDMSVVGYGIYVEDNLIALVDSEATGREVLQYVMDVYSPANAETLYEDVGFAENIDILPTPTKLGKLSSKEDVIYKILSGAEEQKTHIVQSGQTFSEIAKMYGISQADLQASNPTVLPERLSIGQEIILTQAVPLLTVQTVEVSTYIEYLPHDTAYEDNAGMYEGETSTKIKGEDGERSVTAKIVKNNGVEVARLELQSSITKEPITAVLYKGTKKLPPKKGTGTFIMPVQNYTFSSKFGPRWGRMHNGIDLAASTGTKIRASDGGTVTFSGYRRGYGYTVEIDHGGGFVTLYGHCSKLYVKSGEAVYQGQHIANVGSTGQSTGPHLHFEILYLGTPKNPMNYL